MNPRRFSVQITTLLSLLLLALRTVAAPMLDPIANVTLPAGKTLFVPVTATSTNSAPITYTVTSSNDAYVTATVVAGNPWLRISVSNFGDLTFQLFKTVLSEAVAPRTVANISGLVNSGFYDGLTFHRVVANFVIQGGDPLGNGTGGPNFRFDDEFHRLALFTGNGQLAMANSGKDSDGSQIFVTLGPQRHLDFDHTIFGQLVRGFNVLTNINLVATAANNAPLTPVVITKAQIVSNSTDAVLILKSDAPPGSATIKVVASDAKGSVTNTFLAQSVADTVNDPPILNPVSNITSPINTTTAPIFVSGFDLENNVLFYDAAPPSYPPGTTHSVAGNAVRVTPPTGYAGPIALLVGVRTSSPTSRFDTQVIWIGVGDKPLTSLPLLLTGFTGYALSNVTVATFTDADSTSRPTNFIAILNWGDNVVLTNATITTNDGGGFKVTGTHTYNFQGEYPVTVTIDDYLGATTTAFSTTFIAPVPALHLSKVTNQFLISWPVAATNFALQVSTNLSRTTNWLAVTNAPVMTNGEKRVTIPSTNASRFYRLKKT